MRRTLMIARREYFAYARTVGFWLSLLALPFFMALGAGIPTMLQKAAPVRTLAIVDVTGQELGAPLRQAIERGFVEAELGELRTAALVEGGQAGVDAVREASEAGGPEAGLAELRRVAPRAAAAWQPPRRSVVITPPPAEALIPADVAGVEAALRPYVAGDRVLADGRELDAAAVLAVEEGEPVVRLWSRSVTDETVENVVEDAWGDLLRRERLLAAGVDPAAVDAVDRGPARVDLYSPRSASGGEVGLRDRLPAVIGFALGVLLWSAIVTGASILMNSVMEEKSSRVLEVLMSSASTTEILSGKVLGAAMITATVLGVWFAIGAGVLSAMFPEIFGDLLAVLGQGGLIFYLLLYLVGGYLMYAVIFAAIGAFCETPREAQTLLGPVMMVLVIPLIVMNIALQSPDMPLVRILSWVPFFTPFLMSARAPGEPPLIEIAGTIGAMALTAALVVWLAGKAFRAGALSAGKLDWKGVLALVRGQG